MFNEKLDYCFETLVKDSERVIIPTIIEELKKVDANYYFSEPLTNLYGDEDGEYNSGIVITPEHKIIVDTGECNNQTYS